MAQTSILYEDCVELKCYRTRIENAREREKGFIPSKPTLTLNIWTLLYSECFLMSYLDKTQQQGKLPTGLLRQSWLHFVSCWIRVDLALALVTLQTQRKWKLYFINTLYRSGKIHFLANDHAVNRTEQNRTWYLFHLKHSYIQYIVGNQTYIHCMHKWQCDNFNVFV